MGMDDSPAVPPVVTTAKPAKKTARKTKAAGPAGLDGEFGPTREDRSRTARKTKAAPTPSKIRLQLYFDEDVRLDLEHWCIDKRITMSDYVNSLVAKTVPKRKR